MTQQGGNGRNTAGNPLQSILASARVLGTTAAGSMVKAEIRTKFIDLLADHDPDELRRYILVQYPLVANDTPQEARTVIANAGPQFEDEFREYVTAEQILEWLESPEDWMPNEAEKHEEARRCAEVIRSTKGGEQWLAQQCHAIYHIAGIE